MGHPNFHNWHDDNGTKENLAKTEDRKFRPIELVPKEELMERTKTLVPQKMVVL